jgi:hypothetical protein
LQGGRLVRICPQNRTGVAGVFHPYMIEMFTLFIEFGHWGHLFRRVHLQIWHDTLLGGLPLGPAIFSGTGTTGHAGRLRNVAFSEGISDENHTLSRARRSGNCHFSRSFVSNAYRPVSRAVAGARSSRSDLQTGQRSVSVVRHAGCTPRATVAQAARWRGAHGVS